MNLREIKKLQKMYGFDEIQELINSGVAWQMEGSVGRYAMRTLELGATLLPKKILINSYGGMIPSRDVVKNGSTGSKENCVKYWSNFDEKRDLIGW